MTFRPGQIMSSEEWMKAHEGHDITSDHKDYELGDTHVRRMHYRHCLSCEKSHLYLMENVNLATGEATKVG